MSGLFRRAALDKVVNPDQLDETLQVVRPMHVLGILTLALIVLGGFIWGVFSTAPITVQGQGILLSAEGVAVISSPGTGRIDSILVQPGDPLVVGQIVALLQLPTSVDTIAAKQAELDGARHLLEAKQAAHERYSRMQGDLLNTKRLALAEQLNKLQVQQSALVERRSRLQTLLDRGFTTLNRLDEINTQIAELESRIAKLRNDSIELLVGQRGQEVQKAQEIQEASLQVQGLSRELENRRRDYERSRTLIAPVDGTAVEFNVNPGDLVSTGEIVMRLLPARMSSAEGDLALRAIVFVPNEDGKKIRPGMDAQIMPSSVKLQKDGFIRGKVLSVARIPSSREGIMRRLKNATQVDALLRSGAPFEVELELEADLGTPSGYRWSSGLGPDTSIDIGTITSAKMVVGRRRVISLALPAFDHVFRWLEVR